MITKADLLSFFRLYRLQQQLCRLLQRTCADIQELVSKGCWSSVLPLLQQYTRLMTVRLQHELVSTLTHYNVS